MVVSLGLFVGGNANNTSNAGFANSNTNNAPSNANTNIGFQLYFQELLQGKTVPLGKK